MRKNIRYRYKNPVIKSSIDNVTMINAKAKLNEKDFSMAKNYEISIADIDESEFDIEFILDNLSSKKFIRVPVVEDVNVSANSNKTIENGQLAVLKASAAETKVVKAVNKEGEEVAKKVVRAARETSESYKLVQYNKAKKVFEDVDGSFFSKDENDQVKNRFAITTADAKIMPLKVELNELDGSHTLVAETVEKDEYVIVESSVTNVAKLKADGTIEPIAALLSILSHEEGNDFTMAYIDSIPSLDLEANKSIIKVISNNSS